MKFLLSKKGYKISANNEELTLLTKVFEEKKLPKEHLDEREQELARLMTTRGLLNRSKIDGKIFYFADVFEDEDKGLQLLTQTEHIRQLMDQIDILAAGEKNE